MEVFSISEKTLAFYKRDVKPCINVNKQAWSYNLRYNKKEGFIDFLGFVAILKSKIDLIKREPPKIINSTKRNVYFFLCFGWSQSLGSTLVLSNTQSSHMTDVTCIIMLCHWFAGKGIFDFFDILIAICVYKCILYLFLESGAILQCLHCKYVCTSSCMLVIHSLLLTNNELINCKQ